MRLPSYQPGSRTVGAERITNGTRGHARTGIMVPDTCGREWFSVFIYITLVKLLICVRNVPTYVVYARTVYGLRWAAAARGPFSAEAHMSPPLLVAAAWPGPAGRVCQLNYGPQTGIPVPNPRQNGKVKYQLTKRGNRKIGI